MHVIVAPTISRDSHQNISLHTGTRVNVVLFTYLLTKNLIINGIPLAKPVFWGLVIQLLSILLSSCYPYCYPAAIHTAWQMQVCCEIQDGGNHMQD